MAATDFKTANTNNTWYHILVKVIKWMNEWTCFLQEWFRVRNYHFVATIVISDLGKKCKWMPKPLDES